MSSALLDDACAGRLGPMLRDGAGPQRVAADLVRIDSLVRAAR